MENYLLRKMNKIRPNKSLYNNPFRNDNSLKTICQTKLKPEIRATEKRGVTILVRSYSGT